MKPSEGLKKALSILRRDGWGQGQFTCPGGGHCVMGALDVVGVAPFTDMYLRKALGKPYIVEWNDTILGGKWYKKTRRRVPKEVVEVFEKAIKLAKKDERAR